MSRASIDDFDLCARITHRAAISLIFDKEIQEFFETSRYLQVVYQIERFSLRIGVRGGPASTQLYGGCFYMVEEEYSSPNQPILKVLLHTLTTQMPPHQGCCSR